MEYLWAWGTLIHEKNLKLKISCQTPFKGIVQPLELGARLNSFDSLLKTVGPAIFKNF